MPSISENQFIWDYSYEWPEGGNEWSQPWGSAHMQWHGSILPRISAFLPARTIVEIAPGYGRWTVFLKDLCDHLILVDISERCIEECRRRFSNCTHISYFVNDGIHFRRFQIIPLILVLASIRWCMRKTLCSDLTLRRSVRNCNSTA